MYVCLGLGKMGGVGMKAKGHRFLLRVMKYSKIDGGDGYTIL